MCTMKKGKLIIIEGADGAGKTTQTQELRKRLESLGEKTHYIHFPRHEHPSSYFVGRMLRGEYGPLEEQEPYRTSVFYTLDRYDASFELKELLSKGVHVITDRYTSSNVGHQGGKFKTLEEKKKYFAWLDQFEYDTFGIPRPDMVIFLHVPPEVSVDLIAQRNGEHGHNGQKGDIHESDSQHLKDAVDSYMTACNMFDYWYSIPCSVDGQLKSIEEIHKDVYDLVQKELGV